MSPPRVPVAIVGPGNIGTDLLAKLRRSTTIEVAYVVGVVESDGLARARERGIAASAEGIDWLLRQDPLPQIVFEAFLPRWPSMDRNAIVQGYAGVYSSFLPHAEHAAQRYGIPAYDILTRVGELGYVGGQEDMILDVAIELAAQKAEA